MKRLQSAIYPGGRQRGLNIVQHALGRLKLSDIGGNEFFVAYG